VTTRKRRSTAAPPRREPLTAPVEDYLKAIYAIERAGGPAATNDIAQHLDIAPASVSGMVQRLADQGLVAYERYRGVRLTAAGRKAALRTIRRHRVIEAYLVHALGYRWDQVHEEAERLEHAASDALIDRMAAVIGEPRVDPHGAPIPSREGAVEEVLGSSLADLAPGQSAEVARVDDEDAELLRYLDELGLRPGARVLVQARGPFGGPVTVLVNGRQHSIGVSLAARVQVARRSD
jgi:DtxR family Mn-dependent transcriptional regulator